MKKLVWGCFHWAGFHLVREWLEAGETIIGIDSLDTEQKQTLELFIGRNANFSCFESIEALQSSGAGDDIDRVIVMEDHELHPPLKKLENLPASAHFRMDWSEQATPMNSWITIDLPHVYGPWMYDRGREITERSVYITDVLPIISSIVKRDWEQDIVQIGMESDHERNDKSIIQSVSIEEGTKKLKEHQKCFARYYN